MNRASGMVTVVGVVGPTGASRARDSVGGERAVRDVVPHYWAPEQWPPADCHAVRVHLVAAGVELVGVVERHCRRRRPVLQRVCDQLDAGLVGIGSGGRGAEEGDEEEGEESGEG